MKLEKYITNSEIYTMPFVSICEDMDILTFSEAIQHPELMEYERDSTFWIRVKYQYFLIIKGILVLLL